MAIAAAWFAHVPFSKKQLLLHMTCHRDLPLEYALELVHKLEYSASLQLSLDLTHALHEKTA